MVFTFPYHDPNGVYNEIFKKNLPLLRKIFSQLVISATPLTCNQNKEFVNFLTSEGITIYKNKEGSNIGDHFRNALSISLKGLGDSETIFFSFIDRILFVLESKYREVLIKDLRQSENEKLMVFERSTKAWDSHPDNYRKLEEYINSLLQKLSGVNVEMNFCAATFNKKVAMKILTDSISKGWEVPGEWLLLAIKYSLPISTKKVDWLLWEDPFWNKTDSDTLKKTRERSKNEELKRIKTNLPFLDLLTEDRFIEVYKH